jgi:hypothetical protein
LIEIEQKFFNVWKYINGKITFTVMYEQLCILVFDESIFFIGLGHQGRFVREGAAQLLPRHLHPILPLLVDARWLQVTKSEASGKNFQNLL